MHKIILGLHLGACPRMAAIISTITDQVWDYPTMLLNTICFYCNQERLNNWYSCNRRASMINLHPGLLYVRRQHYFIMSIFAKYCSSRDSTILYRGHPDTQSELREYKITDISLPMDLQTRKYIAHGM